MFNYISSAFGANKLFFYMLRRSPLSRRRWPNYMLKICCKKTPVNWYHRGRIQSAENPTENIRIFKSSR